MAKYISILVTKDGYFCVAPPWMVKEGDLICLPDVITGEDKIREVLSVATDEVDGEFATMIKKYVGGELPRITAKFNKSEVEWNEPVQE